MKRLLFSLSAIIAIEAWTASATEPTPPSAEWNELLTQVVQSDAIETPPASSRAATASLSGLWGAAPSGSRNLGLRIRYLVEDELFASLELLGGFTRETSSLRQALSYRLGLTSEAELASWPKSIRLFTSADLAAEHSNGWIDENGAYRDLAPLSYIGAIGVTIRPTRSLRLAPFARIVHEWYFKKDGEKRAVCAEMGVRF